MIFGCFRIRFNFHCVNSNLTVNCPTRSRTESEYAGNARFYLNKARQVNTVAPTDDTAMVEHIQELLQELGDIQVRQGGG